VTSFGAPAPTRTPGTYACTYDYTSKCELTASRSSMGSSKASVDNHLKISATPSLATIFLKESAQIGKPENRTGSCLKSKWLRILENTVLTCVVLFVCGLFTIPTILYIVPPLQVRY
jgi:hypothetical protein